MNRSAPVVFLIVVAALYKCEARRICTGGPHDLWTNCGSACPSRCDQPDPTACVLTCTLDTCECAQGYVRRADNRCVRRRQCNNFPLDFERNNWRIDGFTLRPV